MEQRLHDCLTDQASSEYILPFFWQHGEEPSVLRDEINAIQASGINEFCVESRTHEQFGEEKWWEDFGFILEEAKRRGMRVWLLDDKNFPTGYANNYIADHPELRAVRLRMECRDVAGPQKDVAIIPAPFWGEESYVSIVAYQRSADGISVMGEGIQLLPALQDGLLWWDIPDGNWRIYYVIRTYRDGLARKKNYIDMMSKESCQAMIHAVYEPHYEHFKEYFGNTFAGFFSDEPGFANEGGHYHSTLGREGTVIPWNDEMPVWLAERTGYSVEQVLKLLPVLWHEVENAVTVIRENYMELATQNFSKNFSWLLGDWCRAHGVKYIGHVIEDENAHQRLGHGCGHYFRALNGQDMGGIDIVLHQYIPGLTELAHPACLEEGKADPAFFHYMLPKLASSHAHIQPLKKGRAMCEIYGGFGWGEGIPEMKQMTDLMLAGGINYFVPHAFNAKYPDRDHPPHFYIGGRNTQFPVFGQLMQYTKRMSHMLYGGIHQADVAVYYNAEAEWSGGRCQFQQEVCKELTRHQIDFDILPQDTLLHELSVVNEKALVNEEYYGAIIVPYSQYLPSDVLAALGQLADQGVPVWFVDDYPETSSEGTEAHALLQNCRKVPFSDLAEELARCGLKHLQMEKHHPSLRFFHTRRGAYDIVMLWNESIFSEIDTWISLPVTGNAIFYDAWNNQIYTADQKGNAVRVRLAPAQAIVLCFGSWEETYPKYDYREEPMTELPLTWNISLKQAETESFVPHGTCETLHNMAHELPNFGGIIRYESTFEVTDTTQYHALEFTQVGEIAELWINEEYCGTVVEKPYRFLLNSSLKAGHNQIRVEVMTNLAYKERDMLSSFLTLPITGLSGPVSIG